MRDGREQGRVRVVVTTDPELDDLNSMLRLVLYSNEIELAGLVYSSSMFHFAGDPARGVEAHRWPPAGARGHIDQALDAYAQVHANLVVHDPRYPAPEHLRSLVRQGNIADVGDTREPTPGSDLIADLLLDHEPGTLVLQAWGGLNTIARALMTVDERLVDRPDRDAARARLMARTVLTSWGEQDSTFAEYIRPAWPEIELRQVATAAWGYAARHVASPEALEYLGAPWTRANVTAVGPIGAGYRVWGDGLFMADGFDADDYFGHAGLTDDDLRERGYQVFFPVEEPGAWISEGDTSNVALHIDNGLRNWENPTFGGWGGRQEADPEDPHRWNSVGSHPMVFSMPAPDWGDVGRWIPAFQNDFAGRLRWSVTSSYAQANHHPRIDVPDGLARSAAPGDTVRIAWIVSDPDGDAVLVRPWQYVEAGTADVAVLTSAEASAVDVTIPADAADGATVHVILEATDDGSPALTAYARVIITVVERGS
ncbi:DUF1593 domain-containing protein [Demequina capsici]|uniref:DUF1593 domain-containing protein n=1 Tax=Demequina capsici TaxID=3075620 RepID=A0AA96JEQ0_9MICO|nr:nucleoside hydrolase-like domain-containing protein [Demequina sp. OYTSA14]WNM25979.1 DUF1593 domain-containing protein [Demequina sp. OYTSA14]